MSTSLSAGVGDLPIFKPGARPQPAKGRLWACAWFTEIVFVKVCVCTYLSTYVCLYAPT